MKTFEQYVGEAKQNYIFGGTDDRNTDIDSKKTLGELEVGDYIYFFHTKLSKKPGLFKIHRIHTFGDDDILIDTNFDERSMLISKESLNDVVSYRDRYNWIGGREICGTNEKEFLKMLRKNGYRFSTFDIEDYTLDEAKQNYIFGGTDDRNTKMHVNFEDLTKGDKFYVFNVCLSTKEVTRKIHTFIEFGHPSYSNTEKRMFFMQKNGIKTSIGVSKEALECSLTCTHMYNDIFIIFSTFDIDDEEAINKAKELNASRKKSIYEQE